MKFETIGILGGGQLGRMLAQDARRMGLRVVILDPDPDSSAGQVADRQIVGSFRDPDKVRELAESCDIVTVEIEHVDTDTLEALERAGVRVQPSAATIRLIQDKYAQKTHFAAQNIPLPVFTNAPDIAAVRAFVDEYGYPVVLKAKRLAYDGRGNAVIHAESEIEAAFAALGGYDLYVEMFVPFVKEFAVMVVRGLDGEIAAYPVVETIQRDNICQIVIVPAQISPPAARNALDMAREAVSHLSGAGVFGVELFLLPDDTVLLNEIAPRPHNSGHYTIEACAMSQFEAHLRAILGLPMGNPSLQVGAAAMINILGAETLDETLKMLDAALTIPNASIHWYGKRDNRRGRKLGHITLVGASVAELAPRIAALTNATLQIAVRPSVGIIMGSDSDLPIMRAAAEVLRDFAIPFELTIVSAHRTPERMVEYAKQAHQRGLRAIIAGAGGAAHLPGMVAALTPLPVIGVPVKLETLDGLDALLSIVQMPRGVPVATVAVNNAANAGLLAVRILASSDPTLMTRMIAYQADLAAGVLAKVERLDTMGWEGYTRES
ncbi:MAG: 5-(carboxyamino)imidazole ribonucleotide synthase [Chloroflexota bacterium]|nr:5-(carboxyamino)imidazole ribonucleotide synthase [Chloroflexota bacterium]